MPSSCSKLKYRLSRSQPRTLLGSGRHVLGIFSRCLWTSVVQIHPRMQETRYLTLYLLIPHQLLQCLSMIRTVSLFQPESPWSNFSWCIQNQVLTSKVRLRTIHSYNCVHKCTHRYTTTDVMSFMRTHRCTRTQRKWQLLKFTSCWVLTHKLGEAWKIAERQRDRCLQTLSTPWRYQSVGVGINNTSVYLCLRHVPHEGEKI